MMRSTGLRTRMLLASGALALAVTMPTPSRSAQASRRSGRLGRRGQALALVVKPRALFRRALEVTEIDVVAPVLPTLEAARAHVLPNGNERTA